MNTNERLAQWCRHTRSPFGSVFSGGVSNRGASDRSGMWRGQRREGHCDHFAGRWAFVHGPHGRGYRGGYDGTMRRGSDSDRRSNRSRGRRAQVAGALGDGKSVLRPPAQPLDMTVPRLTWVCSASSASQYTVFYDLVGVARSLP